MVARQSLYVVKEHYQSPLIDCGIGVAAQARESDEG